MSTRVKRRIVIAAAALAVAGLGGTALATSSSGGNSFLDDVAHRLGVSPAKLQSAVNGALADRLDQLVKEGKLTRAQADAILKQAKAHGGAFPFGGWPPFGGAVPFGKLDHHFGTPGEFGFGHHGFPFPFAFPGPGPMGGPFASAAKYLGISTEELVKDLRSGKSLAAVAKAKGKSVSGLESALIAPMRARLDAAVKAGGLTKSGEQRILGKVRDGIHGFVTHGFPFEMHLHHGPDGEDSQGGGASAPAAFGL